MHSLTTGCGEYCGNGQREGIPERAENGLRTDIGIPREIGNGHSGRIKAILYQMMDMPIVRIRSLNLKKNPFLDSEIL